MPGRDHFSRDWPNVVVSDTATIEDVDRKWEKITGTGLIKSPSLQFRGLSRGEGPSAGDISVREGKTGRGLS
ncbi:MAG: hypothetical protein IH591_17360 [Bacteroidales bacterium]|nr:hypothetical protein [Bacteroidales bacterium]